MSTLMSRDLNIERSSTRLHAPPGGKSSISFGDGSSSFDQSEPNKISARSHNKANNMSSLSFGDSNSQQVDDRFTKQQQQAPPQQQQHINYSQGSSMGNLLNGSETENLQPQQYSARSGAAGSSMGNLISGGSESQPSSARGRRQAPGGNSTIVIG